jgi:hypothetical protein
MKQQSHNRSELPKCISENPQLTWHLGVRARSLTWTAPLPLLLGAVLEVENMAAGQHLKLINIKSLKSWERKYRTRWEARSNMISVPR